MNTFDETCDVATRELAELPAKRRYDAPEIKTVGSAVELIQGCGGGAGQDSRYYRIFC